MGHTDDRIVQLQPRHLNERSYEAGTKIGAADIVAERGGEGGGRIQELTNRVGADWVLEWLHELAGVPRGVVPGFPALGQVCNRRALVMDGGHTARSSFP